MKISRLLILSAVLIASLALVSGVLAAASRSHAEPIAAPALQEPGDLPGGEGPWVVRAYYTDQQMVNELAAVIEPWEVNREGGYVVVAVNREQYLWMQWLGFRLEVDEKLTAQYTQPAQPLPGQITGIPGYPCYRTVEETLATGEQIAADYPDLAEWSDIGDSWEKWVIGGLPGYDLKVLRLTNENLPGDKPKLFTMASIHAREYTTAELVTRFAEHLVENYNIDPDITWLLDHHEVHLLLQTNPDGRKIAETGVSWRKNTDSDDGCNDPNSWGTDLNRNFDFEWGAWGGSSGNPCAETYRGPYAGSEPETWAVQNYITAQFPDQRPDDLTTPAPITTTGVFLDIHSYSQRILWPWGFRANPPSPNNTALQTLGRKFAYFNNYSPDPSVELYVTDGTTVDYAYGRLGVAAYTFELGTAFFQDCATFESTILPDNMEALMYAAKAARYPYMTPGGPETLNVATEPVAAEPGELVEVGATVNDTRFFDDDGTEPTQNIAAAEYYIDVPPWSESAVPYPMSATDEGFDEKIEDVQATIDTSGLGNGRHMVFVRGQDVNGNWGQVSAAFLYIVDPLTAPNIEGYVRDYSTNAPLAASLTAGIFTADTLPASGFYNMAVISGTYDVTAQAEGYGSETVSGIYAPDYSLVQQHFNLMPACTIFSDNVEAGNIGWTVQAPWAITTENSHSPTHSWTDSPGGNYSNYRNISLTSPVFDLSEASGVALSFWHIYDTEPGFDFGLVEYSTDGGANWFQVASYSGYDQLTWTQESINLPVLNGQANARIRFRFTSDSSLTADGWHIDDILLTGGSPECIPPLAPTADFSSDSPALPGEVVRFTNLVTGSHPLEFAWDFGDGSGASSDSDPFYTYAAEGTYLVTLTVTNSEGSDAASHPVVIGACTPIEAVTLTLQTPGLVGQPLSLLADIGPQDAHKPYEYSVNYGDGSLLSGMTSDDPLTLTYTYTQAGEFPILFSAQNCGIPPVTDTVSVEIYGDEGIVITPTVASALALPGETVTYTLRVTNTSLFSNTYNLALSESLWESELITTTLGPLEPNQGQDFTVGVRVPDDAAAGASDTVTVTVHSQIPGILPVSASLTTTAGSVYGVNLVPVISEASGMPGELVTHTLGITNTGNTTDTFDISSTFDADGDWSIKFKFPEGVAYQEGALTLAGGQSTELFAVVTIPDSPGVGESTATLVATSSGDPLVSAEASLKTGVIYHQLHLPMVTRQE